MQYCLYLRKSRADSEAEALGEGETLARHEKALLDLAKKLNLNITAMKLNGIVQKCPKLISIPFNFTSTTYKSQLL